MFIVLGATGNIGSEVVRLLAEAGEQVIAVVHDGSKAKGVEAERVEAVVADVRNSQGLREVFKRGKRAFLLNPPGDPTGDSNVAELDSGKSITQALEQSGLEKVVVASTYGAQPGDNIGDLSTLYEFEQGAIRSGIPAAINRGAYYFTNLGMLVDTAKGGMLPTPFPADFALPMVAPTDLARAAVERLRSDVEDVGVMHVEGPARYTFADVAAAFADTFGRDVQVETTPPEQWEESFMAVGFSKLSARSFARMTAATIKSGADLPEKSWRGVVTLAEYVEGLAGSQNA